MITVHAAKLAEKGQQMAAGKAISLQESKIELGVLAVLILVFVFSISRLRNEPATE